VRATIIPATLFGAALITGALLLPWGAAQADRQPDYRGDRWENRGHGDRDWRPRHPHGDRRPVPPAYGRPHGDHRPFPPAYGHPHRDWHGYPRHRHYHYRGNDFLGWLAFSVVTLAIIDNLNEQQQREHELAMRQALGAPVGETIRWNDDRAGGSVTTLRDGTSNQGRYCREYTQDVRVGGQVQQAYGTACRNPDGSWEIRE
jgi:surface antigen